MTFEAQWARAIRGKAAELGLNQADIGRILGMSKQTGHRIWKGTHLPSKEQCDELEAALSIPAGELRVLAGYLPDGDNPKVERADGQILVRLETPIDSTLCQVAIWPSRPIEVEAEPASLVAA